MAILNDILDWVKGKPEFYKVAVDRLIRTNELTESDILDLTEICKAGNGLSEFSSADVDFKELSEIATSNVNNENISLNKITSISNINALSKSSELEFAPNGLTVVYGDNGSGKSSYVSILKHSCNTRGRKPKISHNLYDDNNSFERDRKADIEYTANETVYTANFINEEINNYALKQINVFDAFSANHYIEGEDEIAFIPHGLAIIEKMADGIKKVESRLRLELVSPSLRKFDYELLEVAEGTDAKNFLNTLSSNTSLNELRAISDWTAAKSERAQSLIKQIDELKATDPKAKIISNTQKIDRFTIIANKFTALESKLTGQSLTELAQTLNDFCIKKEALENSSSVAFSDLPIKGVGNNSWKLLWESARRFFNEHTQSYSFPDTSPDSSCPLCLQKLSDEAKSRFSLFEEFVKKDIQKSYDEAHKKYTSVIDSLKKLIFSFDDQIPITSELDGLIENYSEKQTEYLKILSEQKDYIINLFNQKNRVESINNIDIEDTPKTLISGLIESLIEENSKLKTISIDDDLKPLVLELNQLKGVKKLFDHRPKLAREICRLKKIKLLDKCIKECNTRSVTTLSNELATRYVDENLKESFRNELNYLGFRNIKIEPETKGQKGKQYHYLRLDESNHKNIALKDILSEGEHRCISLATFLSEISIAEHKSAVIFDDPVSSLDHKWRNKIAGRMVAEARERQVIAFTHDITFLLMIQEHCKIQECELDIKSLTRKKYETGIIAKNPPWDALNVKNRIKILNMKCNDLKVIEESETEEVYKEHAKRIYNKLREAWERLVEEVFLNGTIQRFGRAVQTQRLAKVVDISIEDYNIIDLNMSKCSTYFYGHDSSGELNDRTPDSEEISGDIKILDDFRKEIIRRRN